MTNLALKLAENARSAGIKTAYGDPVEIDGTTIVPVALSYYGFGGGGGDAESPEGMSGGGGGGMSAPIGAYLRSGGRVHFEPNVIALLAVGIPFVSAAGLAIARIVRALKK